MVGKIAKLPFIAVTFLIPVSALEQLAILEPTFIVGAILGDPESLTMGGEITEFPLVRAAALIADGALNQLTLFELTLPGGIVTGELPFPVQDAVDKLALLSAAAPIHQLAVAIKPPFVEFPFVVATIRPGQRTFAMEEIITGVTVIHRPVRQTQIRRPLHRITANQRNQRNQNHSKAEYFHR